MQVINFIKPDGSLWKIARISDRTANDMERLAKRRRIPVQDLYQKAISEALKDAKSASELSHR
jgi:predicted HTH domain antitoxin